MQKTIKIPAKINLYLDVVSRMENGYHELESVMQSVDIFDIVTLTASRGKGNTEVIAREGKSEKTLGLPQPKNTAYRAAKLFAETFPYAKNADGLCAAECDFKIELIKNIPSEAGLGGASADAAAVLMILCDMFSAGISTDELAMLGAKIGADVPFCIKRGTMLARGIGEKLERMTRMPTMHLLIAKPFSENISTPAAFAEIDARGLCRKSGDISAFCAALESGDIKAAAALSLNKFEKILPYGSAVFAIKETMLACGAHIAQMSGSGSAVFGIFENASDFRRAEKALKKTAWLYPCHTVSDEAELYFEDIDLQ